MKARLVGWRELAPATRHFEFECAEWDGAFVAGQFLSFSAEVNGSEVTRSYSIASAPVAGSGRFSVCANRVDGGRFSPWLFAMQTGDAVECKGPYGTFTARQPFGDSIFVANGTGIGPFRSMLLANPEIADRATLIFGVRHREELLYHDELRRLHGYRPTLTRPPEDWAGLTGRVQSHVFEALGDRRDVDVYLCGLKEMVDDMRAQLKAAGVDRKRIIYEKYD